MVTPTHTLALALPGILRLGRWHVPIFGLFASALWLSQKTARDAGLAPDAIWDAGWFGVVAAFAVSRLLLVLENWSAFLRFPVLVLALPSLTYAGIAITAVLLLVYLRARRIAVLRALDAWAPCAALLVAILSLGHFVEGTDAGMPTRLPWGLVTPGDSVLGKVHPVQLYTMVLALLLCAWALLQRSHSRPPGRTAAFVLTVGGLLSFALDMLRQPVDTFSNAWLDPAQWVALGAIATGLLFFVGPSGAPKILPQETL
jgi:phosphatidylglycerol:prolipoprotein diacylglycerol transferase